MPRRAASRPAAWAALVTGCALLAAGAARAADAVLIRLDPSGKVTVTEAKPAAVEAAPPALGQPLVLTFPDGQERVAWAELKGLPKELAENGLPAGNYTLTPEKGASGEPVVFTIEAEKDRAALLKSADDLADLLGSRTDPLY